MRASRERHLVSAAVAVALLGPIAADPLQNTPDRLALGTKLTRRIEGAAVDRLAIPLTAGQFIKIVVMQTGTDVVVTLRDPQGRVLMESDLPNGAFGAETVAAVADSPGGHVVEVRNGNPRGGGSYEATLDAARDATPADRELASAYQTLAEANLLRKKRTPDTRRQAIDLLKNIRPTFAMAGDHYSEAMTVIMTGLMLAEAGEITMALRYAEEAAGLFYQASDWFGEATARNNMGGMLDILGEPERALESYRQALRLHGANGSAVEEARVLNNIGKIETDLGNWQSALDNYRRALALVHQAGNAELEGLLRYNIGFIYSRLGDLDAAISAFEQALLLHRLAQNRSGEGVTLQGIARVYASSNQLAKALDYLQRALGVYTGLGDRRKEAEIRRDLGGVYAELGRLPEAEDSLRKAVDGERAARDRRNTAVAMRDLSRVLLLKGKPTDALQPAEEAVAEFRAMGDRNSEATALEAAARAESELGRLTAARDRMEAALRLTEESRMRTDSEQFRASFLATRQDSYSFFIDLLMRMQNPSAALEASERSRARSMLEMLAESGISIREGVDPKLLAREREISNLLNAKGARLLNSPQSATLQREVRELDGEYRDLQAAIRTSSPRYAALTQPQPLRASQIQQDLLDEDTLLLEYSLGEKRSYLWALGKSELHSWELPPRAKIEQQIERVSRLLTARSAAPRMEAPAEKRKRIADADAALPSASRELSDMILTPAAAMLGNRTLAIVPDGALQRLPFAMLPAPETREPLIASHEVVMLPSASALAVLRQEISGRKPAPKMLAVFADPVFDATDPRAGHNAASSPSQAESARILEHLAEPGGNASTGLKIPRLPYTAREAEQILSVARGAPNLQAIGFEASRAVATSGQLSDYRYLHFATHGYLDTERPSLSALVLSQIDKDHQPQDGFLRVNDVYNERLAADLVVLSACQTGLGKEVRGEGLMGLTRAFLYAGAPRVIVSLWNVNDRATADLMAAFYRRMLREHKRPSAALREAQLEMRKQKQWESPYYWAAFVQHGEWR